MAFREVSVHVQASLSQRLVMRAGSIGIKQEGTYPFTVEARLDSSALGRSSVPAATPQDAARAPQDGPETATGGSSDEPPGGR
jgi:hypothetical protein